MRRKISEENLGIQFTTGAEGRDSSYTLGAGKEVCEEARPKPTGFSDKDLLHSLPSPGVAKRQKDKKLKFSNMAGTAPHFSEAHRAYYAPWDGNRRREMAVWGAWDMGLRSAK